MARPHIQAVSTEQAGAQREDGEDAAQRQQDALGGTAGGGAVVGDGRDDLVPREMDGGGGCEWHKPGAGSEVIEAVRGGKRSPPSRPSPVLCSCLGTPWGRVQAPTPTPTPTPRPPRSMGQQEGG